MWTSFFSGRKPGNSLPRSRSAQKVAAALVLAGVCGAGFLTWRAARQGTTPGAPPPQQLQSGKIPRGEVSRVNGLLVRKGESTPFSGVLFENYPDGSRKLEMEVRAGRLEGSSKGWFSNGQIETDETFAADYAEGLRTRWHPNGVKKSIASIRHGELQGLYTEWHDNAQKAVSMTMREGKPDGSAESWHRSGALKSRGRLEKGKIVTQEFFDDPAAATAQAKAP